MTNPVVPPDAPVVPVYPPLGSLTFNQDAYTYGNAMPAVSVRFGEMGQAAYINSLSSKESALAAQQSALDAANAAAPALAAANFKGLWPTLAGPLNKPACVKHNGRFWLLLNNLADVTLSQPGVSADWTSMDSGRITQTITANTTAVAGVYYIATTAGITLTIPAGFLKGDTVGGRNASGSACWINWTTNTVAGEVPEAPMRWPTRGKFETTHSGSTFA